MADPDMPDADDAAGVADIVPDDPPADAPTIGDPDKKPAVAAPVPAHGEMASAEQLAEGAGAVDAAGGGGVPKELLGTRGEGDRREPGAGDPERTARDAIAVRDGER